MYNGMKVVAVMQEKGGVGKTTIALNLALSAANGVIPQVKKKVLLFDFDDQQNASIATLPMKRLPRVKAWQPPQHPDYDENNPEDYEWGGRSTAIDLYYGNLVVPYPTAISDNLEVLPSDGKMLKTFEDRTSRVTQQKGEGILVAILNELRAFFDQAEVQELYDMVVIDCPPGINLITSPILRACTDVVIPVELEPLCMAGFENLMTEIEELNQSGEREAPINIAAIIPNKYDPRISTIHGAILESLRADERTLVRQSLLDPIQSLTEFKSQWLPLGDPQRNSLKGKARDQMDSCMIQIGQHIYGKTKTRARKKAAEIGS